MNSSVEADDAYDLMKFTLGLSRRTMRRGNPPFAALLAIGKKRLLTASNTCVSDAHPLKHAELKLLMVACKCWDDDTRKQTTLYCTTEPCGMCMGAVHWAGIKTVVCSTNQQDLIGIRGHGFCLPESILRSDALAISIHRGMLREESLRQLRQYYGKVE